jgi:hypothetical protein
MERRPQTIPLDQDFGGNTRINRPTSGTDQRPGTLGPDRAAPSTGPHIEYLCAGALLAVASAMPGTPAASLPETPARPTSPQPGTTAGNCQPPQMTILRHRTRPGQVQRPRTRRAEEGRHQARARWHPDQLKTGRYLNSAGRGRSVM